MPQPELIVGLMSGTSVDGIDAALVELTSPHHLNVLEKLFIPYESTLKQRINRLAQSKTEIDRSELSAVNLELANCYADASTQLIARSGVSKKAISAIANHGQTVRHEPNAQPPYSVQLGDTQSIANLTGIETIGQFRQADLAAGGQGAPLMPAFHSAIFGIEDPQALILNIGGIANLTKLSKQGGTRKAIGFDTGPGNTLLDQWIYKCRQENYDEGGAWADSGDVIESLLSDLLGEPYFSETFPKSTGPDYFNLSWLMHHLNDQRFAEQDVQATLLELTIETIRLAIGQLDGGHSNLYVCGGGAHNTAMMSGLAVALPNLVVQSTDILGIPSDWVEATGFAWLGYCHRHGITSNLPSVTGASKAVVLGESCRPNLS